MPLEFAHALAATKVSTDPVFIMGAMWPDIRYLARIDRKITHQETLPTGLSSEFSAGIQLHRDLDLQWSAWAPRDSKVSISVYKLFFDDYLIKGTSESIVIPNTIFADEQLWKIDDSTLIQWHTFIQKYVDSKTLDELVVLIKETIPLPASIWIDVEEQIRRCRQDPHLDQLMEQMYDLFEDWIRTYRL